LGGVKSLELFCKDLIPHLQLDEERFQLFGWSFQLVLQCL
jgi:hypothetical protein